MILLLHQVKMSEAKQCLTQLRRLLLCSLQQCPLLVYNLKPVLQGAFVDDALVFFAKGDRAMWLLRIQKKYLKSYMSYAYRAVILLCRQAAFCFAQLIDKAFVPIKIARGHVQQKGINIFFTHQAEEEKQVGAMLVSSQQFLSNIKHYEY